MQGHYQSLSLSLWIFCKLHTFQLLRFWPIFRNFKWSCCFSESDILEWAAWVSHPLISCHCDFCSASHYTLFFCVIVVATAKYGVLSESIRSSMAEARLCSMFCGGKTCKYEGAAKWSPEQQAIKGLYSNWLASLMCINKHLLFDVHTVFHPGSLRYYNISWMLHAFLSHTLKKSAQEHCSRTSYEWAELSLSPVNKIILNICVQIWWLERKLGYHIRYHINIIWLLQGFHPLQRYYAPLVSQLAGLAGDAGLIIK